MYPKALAFLILTYKHASFVFSHTLTKKEEFFEPEHISNCKKKAHRLNENQRNDIFNEIINRHKKMEQHSVAHEQHHEKREFLLLKGWI